MVHEHFLKQALEVAAQCRDIQWYGVGCVIVDSAGALLSTGFTGELKDAEGTFRHAEDIALEKAASHNLAGATLYSTLEPCSVRASGKMPCVDRIVSSGIGTVVFGAKEPFDPALNIRCEGAQKLKDAGIRVTYLSAMEPECLRSVVSRRIAQKA